MKEFDNFAETCRCELTESIMPFWMVHGQDRENGGVYTCLDRDGNSIFDSAQEVNLYSYMRFIRDSSATAEKVLDEWADRRWPKCRDEMKALARKSFELVGATQFIDHNVCFHQNPPTPSFKFIKFSGILGVFRILCVSAPLREINRQLNTHAEPQSRREMEVRSRLKGWRNFSTFQLLLTFWVKEAMS